MAQAPSTESGTTATTSLLTPVGGISPFTASKEPLPSLTKLQIRAKTSRSNPRSRKALVSYTLSAPATVELAVYHRTASHRCRRGLRTCDRWAPTKIKLKVTGHAGSNSLTLNLATLAPGHYRLGATPIDRSGATGVTQYLRFDTAG